MRVDELSTHEEKQKKKSARRDAVGVAAPEYTRGNRRLEHYRPAIHAVIYEFSERTAWAGASRLFPINSI